MRESTREHLSALHLNVLDPGVDQSEAAHRNAEGIEVAR